MEHRKHPRFAVQIPVDFTGEEAEGRGQVLNLSMGGCAIESAVTPAAATYLKLSLLLPNERSSLQVELAPVRWSVYRHFGVEFIRMQPEAQSVLRRFVDGLDAGTVEPSP